MSRIHCSQKLFPIYKTSLYSNTAKYGSIRDRDIINTERKHSEIGPMQERRLKENFEDPIERTFKILKNDMRLLKHKVKNLLGFEEEMSHDLKFQSFPTTCDVIIIGGGVIAESIAYWMKKRVPNGLEVIVVDSEEKFSGPSVSVLGSHFYLPEYVKMSLFGCEFLRDAKKFLKIPSIPTPDMMFHPTGCLTLSSTDLDKIVKMQNILGAHHRPLSKCDLNGFSWLRDHEYGCLGLSQEGVFIALALEEAYRQKNVNLGAQYVNGEIEGFEFIDQHLIIPAGDGGLYKQIDRVVVKLPTGESLSIKFGICIMAGNLEFLTKKALIGAGKGFLGVPIPVESRKRYLFDCEMSDLQTFGIPVISYGDSYLIHNPFTGKFTVSTSAMDVASVAAFLNGVVSAPVGKINPIGEETVEENVFDGVGLVGFHPYYHNLLISGGFGVDSASLSPAVGRGVMELILDGEYKTIDLSRLGLDRVFLDERMSEDCAFQIIR